MYCVWCGLCTVGAVCGVCRRLGASLLHSVLSTIHTVVTSAFVLADLSMKLEQWEHGRLSFFLAAALIASTTSLSCVKACLTHTVSLAGSTGVQRVSWRGLMKAQASVFCLGMATILESAATCS